MIVASGEWRGLDSLGEDILAELRPRAAQAVERSVIHLTGEVQRTLAGKRTGRSYKVSKTGRLHIASAPGEPPAVLTGRLRQSIAFTAPEWEGNTVSARVGTNVAYARRLEYGGIDSRGVKIDARPYWAPAYLKAEPVISRFLEAL
jgi:phage gpG-like protein